MSASDDKEEIRELMARYNLAMDYPDIDAWVDCWAEDGVLDFQGRPKVEGKEALHAYGKDRTGGFLHLTLNHIIDVDGDVAHATSYLALLAAKDSAPVVGLGGRYDDDLRRVDGRWKFVLRVLEPRLRPGG